MSKFTVLALAGVALSSAATASITVLEIDVNTLTGNAGGAFSGVNHTGTVTLTNNATSVLSEISVDGVAQPLGSTMVGFSGHINLNLGQVTGGDYDITLADGSAMHAMIDILGGGAVHSQVGQGFRIDGLTAQVSFTNLVGGVFFGGVNVAQYGPGPFSGSFLAFSFNPNALGIDNTTDYEIYTNVPAPGAAALLGLAGLTAGRRRR